MGNSGSIEQEVELAEETKALAMEVFNCIDTDRSESIDMDETLNWWDSNYPVINARAMFQAVDEDQNGCIDKQEWMKFWQLVKKNGYSDKEIRSELLRLKGKESWKFLA